MVACAAVFGRFCAGKFEKSPRRTFLRAFSALPTVRNADFHVTARRQIADFQTPHLHHRRMLSAESADGGRAFCSVQLVMQCFPQFSFVMPTLAIPSFRGDVCGIRAPGSHVEAVVSAAFREPRAARAVRTSVRNRRSNDRNRAIHHDLPFSADTFRRPAVSAPSRARARYAYRYPGTIAFRIFRATLRARNATA